MAGTLPVERAIADAYRFAFAGFLSVLGTVWLPYLILILIVFGLIHAVAPDVPKMLATGDLDFVAGMELLRLGILVGILAFIVGAMVTVDLQRKAMATKTGRSYVFFSLAGPVWRMAGASFLAVIVVGIVAGVALFVCFAIWSAAATIGAAGGLIRAITIFATIALIIYIMLRLMFFLPAVVVAENSIGLERAWILGGRNFWRILLVSIAVVLPVVIVFHLVPWALFGSLSSLRELGARGGLRALLRAGWSMQYGPGGYLMLFLEIIERILLLGLLNGAVASAYLAVNGDSPTATPQVATPQ